MDRLSQLWRDRWCFSCRSLRRFERDAEQRWRCVDCQREATVPVQRDLDDGERT